MELTVTFLILIICCSITQKWAVARRMRLSYKHNTLQKVNITPCHPFHFFVGRRCKHISPVRALSRRLERTIWNRDQWRWWRVWRNSWCWQYSAQENKASWARLIAKIYEADPMICPKCFSEMRIIAIITSEYELKRILRHLAKTGKSPPGLTQNVWSLHFYLISIAITGTGLPWL